MNKNIYKQLVSISNDEQFQNICKEKNYSKLEQYLVSQGILDYVNVSEQEVKGVFIPTVAIAAVQLVAAVETAIFVAAAVVGAKSSQKVLNNELLKRVFAIISKISDESFSNKVYGEFKKIELNDI